MTRVYISPHFKAPDKGDGGIRRVVEAQHRWLPQYGIEIVDTLEAAEVAAFHAGSWGRVPANVPVVAHCHGLYWEGYEWEKWAIALNKDVIRTMHLANVVTATAEWVAQAIRRGSWIDPVVLYHGIDPEDWSETSRQKGNYVLWNKTRIDPICDPAPVDELAKRVRDVEFVTTFGKKRPNVTVTGPVPYDQAKDHVYGAGVYLATSRETFGIGTLEAMAAGVPVVGWNWGGQAEFVRHKTDGYLAKPGDYDDLAEGLQHVLKHREQMGRQARERAVIHFSWEERMKPYAELFQRLAEEAREKRPKVSVVITNYNLGEYLPDAIESVLKSTLQNIEVVVVDDASTEQKSKAIVKAIDAGLNPKLRVVHNEENQYLAEALNIGISASTGEYILPLDADNMIAPNALEVLAKALDEDRELDIAYGAMEVIRPDGSRFVSGWPPAEFDLDQQLAHRNQISSTALYRRRVWSRTGGYRRRCHTAEDADFWCRAGSFGFRGRKVTGAVTLIYRDRDDSMSHVQKDWAWHRWYPWGARAELRPWVADGERIPTHEFPIVSVVIPVGPGHERLVLDALDSLQAQTFRHWEAIVINDTGKSLPWIHPWAKQYGTRPVPKGAAVARNIGLEHAKAPYVLFLDADDYLHPEAIERMYSILKEEGGFVYTDWFVAETGEIKSAPEFDCKAVLKQLPYPVTCMYDKRVLDQKSIRFDSRFASGWEDWDFAIQAVVKAGMCGTRVATPLFHYRIHSGSLRERAYARRDELKHVVYNKWEAYYTGKEQNMACGCGNRRTPSVASYGGAMPPTTQADSLQGEVTLLEYTVSDTSGSRSFVGRVTGNRYRFGTTPDTRVRRVYNADVDGLLALGFFQRYTGPTGKAEPLMAAGPPSRA